MQPTQTAVSNKRFWAGRFICALAVLFLIFGGARHTMMPAPAAEAFARLGYPASLALGVGLFELVCSVVQVIPRSAVLGAILLTGYLGGATASNLHAGDPLCEAVFPVIFGAVIWAGALLR